MHLLLFSFIDFVLCFRGPLWGKVVFNRKSKGQKQKARLPHSTQPKTKSQAELSEEVEVVRRSVAEPKVAAFEGQSPSENLNPEKLRRSTDCNNSEEGTAIVAATEAIDFAARSPAFV